MVGNRYISSLRNIQLFFPNISLLSIPDTNPKVKGFCDNFLTLKESETVFPLKILGIYAKKVNDK